MKPRVVWSYTSGVIAIFAIGAVGIGLWSENEFKPARVSANSTTPVASHNRAHRKTVPSYLPGLLPSMHGAALKWSPMGEIVNPHHESARNIRITRAMVPAPLNLELPTAPVTTAQSNANASALDSDIGDGASSSETRLVINLDPHRDSREQRFADDARLFNHSNGLRGFMAHNWLTKTVGLQGGLAVKENRLRDENSDLQNNVAVGMGVLLAF